MKGLIVISGILGVLLFVTASILGGAQIEGYSIVSQYISESYAQGLPNTSYLSYMYIASGILLAFFGFTAPAKMASSRGLKIGFILFAIFYGLGTISTGYFPCDIGCDSEAEGASLSQIIHNATGFLTYAIVPFCLIGIGVSSRKMKAARLYSKVTLVCGVIAFCFVLLLFGNPSGPFIGLFQRIIESSILFWVIYTSFYIRRTLNI
jgi:hypothetical protein